MCIDGFADLLAHLATVHPSLYVALRFVVLVDRLYDRDVPVLLGGAGEQQLFTPEMLAGGYRAKYFRALSRLGALTGAARAQIPD